MYENLSFKLREDLTINRDTIQSISIKISSTKSKNIIIDTIYRSMELVFMIYFQKI